MSKRHGILSLKKSIQARRKYGASLDSPLPVFDFSEKMGVEVKFRHETSLEGMYYKNENLILVTSHRPFGRQAFTCAHELGHHVFGHGTSVDEIIEGDFSVSRPEQELEADLFAAHLLMPLVGIKKAFQIRKWTFKDIKTHQAYSLASLFGVTYRAFITHLHFNLDLISDSDYKRLLKIAPKSIKSSLLGFEYSGELTVVDRYWDGRPVDLICGQYAIFTKNLHCNGLSNVELISEKSRYFIIRATRQGVTETTINTEALFIRVSGKENSPYVGRNAYRYLEEPLEHT